MKHKHCELIKAWADGADIEFRQSLSQAWVSVKDPVWAENTEYRIKPAVEIPEGFTPWHGGFCPVKAGTLVDVIYRDGQRLQRLPAQEFVSQGRCAAYNFWRNDNMENDIIAYRLSTGKIVRWQWIMKTSTGRIYVYSDLLSEAEMGQYQSEFRCCVIGKAEWTRMEFDE